MNGMDRSRVMGEPSVHEPVPSQWQIRLLVWLFFACIIANGRVELASATTVTTPMTTRLPNGTVVTTLPGGITITEVPDQGVTISFPDGSKTEVQKGSTSTYTTRPDGTRVITYRDGSTTTILPSGRWISQHRNGVTITGPGDGSKVTTYPDGRTVTEPVGGGSTTKYPNGRTVTKQSDGTIVTTFPEGTTITERPDGTKITKHPDGRTVTRRPDGTKTTELPNGSTTTKHPDGRTANTLPPQKTVPASPAVEKSAQVSPPVPIPYPNTSTLSQSPKTGGVGETPSAGTVGAPASPQSFNTLGLQVAPKPVQTPAQQGMITVPMTPLTGSSQTTPILSGQQGTTIGLGVQAPQAKQATQAQPASPAKQAAQVQQPPLASSSTTQKSFTPSNFQISLGSLPVKSVTKIDSVTVKTSEPTSADRQRAFGIVPRGLESEPEENPLPPSLRLDAPVQFRSPAGASVAVPPGNYQVVELEQGIGLLSLDLNGPPMFTLAAQPTTYEGTIPGPGLLWLPSEQADHQLLLLLGPDGDARYTVGSTNLIQPRAVTKLPAPRQFLFPGGEGVRLVTPAGPGVRHQGTNKPVLAPPKGSLQVIRCDQTSPPAPKPGQPQGAGRPSDGECRDVSPGALHVILGNFLGAQGQAVTEDRTTPVELRSDFILDSSSRPVDAASVGGRVPVTPGSGTPAPKLAPMPQGQKPSGLTPGPSSQRAFGVVPRGTEEGR